MKNKTLRVYKVAQMKVSRQCYKYDINLILCPHKSMNFYFVNNTE